MGPILCIMEASKINKIGEECCATCGPEIGINNLLYVDDIVGVVIENTVKNSRLFE